MKLFADVINLDTGVTGYVCGVGYLNGVRVMGDDGVSYAGGRWVLNG